MDTIYESYQKSNEPKKLDEKRTDPLADLESVIFNLEATIEHRKRSIGSRSGPKTPEEVADDYNTVLKQSIKILLNAKKGFDELIKIKNDIINIINKG